MAVVEARLKPSDGGGAHEELPPLENGAHLDQPTFHARYEAMAEHVRAELIGGVVVIAPRPCLLHGRGALAAISWLTAYEVATPGTETLAR